MFNWACPRCGREVSPAYNQCPSCSQTVAAAAQAPPSAARRTPFASSLLEEKEHGRRAKKTDKIALYALEAMGASWFFLPFFSLGRDHSTIFELGSDVLIRSIGIGALALALLAVRSRSRLVRCLYFLPLAYVAGLAYLDIWAVNAWASAESAEAKKLPLFGDVFSGLAQGIASSITFDYGAYIFAVAALVLLSRIFSSTAD
jgi:hypothetical protein